MRQIVVFCFFMPRVFGWADDDGKGSPRGVFHKRPHLRDWYYNSMMRNSEAAALAGAIISDKNAR